MNLSELKHGDTIIFQKSIFEQRTFPIKVIDGMTVYEFSLNSRVYNFNIDRLEPFKHLLWT